MFALFIDTIIIIILTICLFGLYYLYSDNIKLLIAQPIKLKKKAAKVDKCPIEHDYGFERFGSKGSNSNKESNDTVRYDDDHLEKFELDQDSVDRTRYESKLCKFKDDTGWVCPIHYNEKGKKILPYQECSKDIQKRVCKHLFNEWSEESKLDDIDETHYYITRNWKSGDILYILIDDDKDQLLGFVAIDRKQFYPFISHLFVVPSHRKNGYGKLLMDFSIEYIKAIEFTDARLWCKRSLVPYYENYGWEILDEKNPKTIVMIKNI